MSRIIEIIDSDEEITEQLTTTTTAAIDRKNKSQMAAATEVKKSRRKSVLQSLQDADVHFETIYVEDEEVETNNLQNPETSTSPGTKAKHLRASGSDSVTRNNRKQRFGKTKYIKKPEEVERMFNKFMSSPETVAGINRIAEERVRINFLLATLNVPLLDLQPFELNLAELNKQLDDNLKDKLH